MALLLLVPGGHAFQLAAPHHATHSMVAREWRTPRAPTSRENYVPSWAQRPTGANNVYGEQQSEYEAYAKYLKAREAGANIEESAAAAEPAAAAAEPAAAPPAAEPPAAAPPVPPPMPTAADDLTVLAQVKPPDGDR
eukprot:135101-Prymnesium_polylepis.1